MKTKLSKNENINILNIIHNIEDNNLLYRDLLLWYPENYLKSNVDSNNTTTSKRNFRIDEIGNWLLDNHRPFKEDYKNLHHKKSVRLHQKRDTIKKAVNDLIKLELMDISKEIESDRNKSIKTIEYNFTDIGIIVSWLLNTYKKKNTEDYIICSNMFLSNFLNLFQKSNNALIYEFISNLLNNCNKNKLIEKFVELDKYIGLFIKLIYREDLISIRTALLSIISLNKKILETFIDTINAYNDNKKNILLYQFKLEIESLFENVYRISNILKDWEIMRYENIDKEDIITMIGNCPNCGIIPFTVNIFKAFRLFWICSEFYFLVGNNSNFGINRELLDEMVNNSKTKNETFIQKEQCSKCKNNDLKISFLIQKNTKYEEIFIYINKNMNSLTELANRSDKIKSI